MKRIAVTQDSLRVSPEGLHLEASLEGSPHSVVASGAGLSRVLRAIESNSDFVIITPFRGVNSFSQNVSAFKALPKRVRQILNEPKIGGYWLIGHWTECSVDLEEGQTSDQCVALGGKLQHSLEYSWLFVRPQYVPQKEWLAAFSKIAKEYKQDAFVSRSDGKTAVVAGSDGTVWESLSTVGAIEGTLEKLAWLRANRAGYGYTELKKLRDNGRIQPIVFEVKSASKESFAENVRSSSNSFALYQVVPASSSQSQAFIYHEGVKSIKDVTAKDIGDIHRNLWPI